MKQAPFSDFDEAERREFIRTHRDSAERWLRYLVDVTLSQLTGPKYLTQRPWKNEFVRQVFAKISDRPDQFKREIDATTFDQLIDMVCHPAHWNEFEDALTTAYPDGIEEAKTFLMRLKAMRNDAAHVRPCSVRQMEQALCYGNDLADSIKAHFQRVGMAKEFNVPTFVSFSDSLGNSGHFTPADSYLRGEMLDTHGQLSERHRRMKLTSGSSRPTADNLLSGPTVRSRPSLTRRRRSVHERGRDRRIGR